MRKLLIVALLGLAAISPILGAVGAPFFYDAQVILDSKGDPALRTFLARASTNTQEQISILLVFDDIPTSQQISELSRLGTIETFTGHVANIRVPVDLLPQVSSLGFVSRVSYPKQSSARLDTSVPEILANKVWQDVRDAGGSAVNGTGVVVGIVDTGIDYTHRDFFFKNGTSKILYLWDQSTKGKAPLGFGYGNECSRIEIQARTCSEIDGETNGFSPGHGTAVAAVAASSGQAAGFFESCLRYDGTTWYNDKVLCQDSGSPSVPLLAQSSDYRYFGSVGKFNQLFVEIESAGGYGNFIWEYSLGLGNWNSLSVESNQTLNLARTGTIRFTPPDNWINDSVHGSGNQYWIRVRAASVQKAAMIRHIQSNPPYMGVAPNAMIIAVKLRNGGDDSVLNGINYIVKRARQLNLPFVVNYSFGDGLGSHDGTEPLELAFTDLASQGVPFVIDAGNSGNANLHVSGKLSSGRSVNVAWATDRAQKYVDLWYPTTDNIAISVTTPSRIIVPGPTPERGVKTSDGNVVILADKRATGKEWWINITSASNTLLSLRWSFNLTGISVQDGKWDAWAEPGEFLSDTPASRAGLYKIDPFDTIDSPGISKEVIAVGAYMTKYYWRSGCDSCIDYTNSQGLRGVWWVPTEASGVGNITYYSSMGPTRDGRTKPEIVAPGSNVAAARASNRPNRNSDPDNYHQIWRGTSFSAPHVAGVIALMLQMNHYLSPNQIRTILTQNARQDEFTGPISKQTGSPVWGWGKINALTSTFDAPSLYTITVQIDSLGLPLKTNLTLDGSNVLSITLNQTKQQVFEFQRGGTHTLELSPTIQVGSGSMYQLLRNSWSFDSGGVRRFHYQLLFLLEVTSRYGEATGGGWYEANSTAIINVSPTEAEGYVFQGWRGSITSNSPTVEIRMDSSKQVTAFWVPSPRVPNLVEIIVILALAISITLIVILRYKLTKQRRNRA